MAKPLERMDWPCALADFIRKSFRYEGAVTFRPSPVEGMAYLAPSFHISLFPRMEAENELISTGPAPKDR